MTRTRSRSQSHDHGDTEMVEDIDVDNYDVDEDGSGVFTFLAIGMIALGLIGAVIFWFLFIRTPPVDPDYQSTAIYANDSEEEAPMVDTEAVASGLNRAPRAEIRMLQTDYAPPKFQFSASYSDDPDAGDGDALTAKWHFGGGIGDTTAMAGEVVFPEARSYTITLTVSDPQGAEHSVEQVVKATERPAQVENDPNRRSRDKDRDKDRVPHNIVEGVVFTTVDALDEEESQRGWLREVLVAKVLSARRNKVLLAKSQGHESTVEGNVGVGNIQIGDHFIARWTGFMYVPEPGRYQFEINSDDGALLKLGGIEIINHDGRHAASARRVSVDLEQNWYPVQVDYFQNGGEQKLLLRWRLEGDDWGFVNGDTVRSLKK